MKSVTCKGSRQQDPNADRIRYQADVPSPYNKLFNPIVRSHPNTVDRNQVSKADKARAKFKSKNTGWSDAGGKQTEYERELERFVSNLAKTGSWSII